QAQPDRVLQAAAAAPSRAGDVQGRQDVLTGAGHLCRPMTTSNCNFIHVFSINDTERVGKMRHLALDATHIAVRGAQRVARLCGAKRAKQSARSACRNDWHTPCFAVRQRPTTTTSRSWTTSRPN